MQGKRPLEDNRKRADSPGKSLPGKVFETMFQVDCGLTQAVGYFRVDFISTPWAEGRVGLSDRINPYRESTPNAVIHPAAQTGNPPAGGRLVDSLTVHKQGSRKSPRPPVVGCTLECQDLLFDFVEVLSSKNQSVIIKEQDPALNQERGLNLPPDAQTGLLAISMSFGVFPGKGIVQLDIVGSRESAAYPKVQLLCSSQTRDDIVVGKR